MDPDAGETLTFSLVNALDNSQFNLNGTQLRTNAVERAALVTGAGNRVTHGTLLRRVDVLSLARQILSSSGG